MEDLIAGDSFTQNKELLKPMRKVFHVYIYPYSLPFNVANFAFVICLCLCTCLTINICQLLMNCFRFNNTITMQRNYRLDPMTWWNPGPEFMSQYQLLKLGFPEDTMLYQVEPYIQMLMKSSIYKGLWCTRYVCHLTPHLFPFDSFLSALFFISFCYFSYRLIAFKYLVFVAYSGLRDYCSE
jgi:hypothetical protein